MENGVVGVKVMTDEQMEMLRKQISVYATICENLVQMHQAICSQQDFTGIQVANLYGYSGPYISNGLQRIPSRQRWAPKAAQLQILESIFGDCNTTPDRQKIREITSELAKHGPVSETNVYNWFQNRRARSKRKQAALPTLTNTGESQAEPAEDKNTNQDDTIAQMDESLEFMVNDMYFQNPEIQGIEQLIGRPEVTINYKPHWPDLFG
ncbi:hypothetical protein JCGZ_08069 [Jatropha curcas]|uniref:Homeobox domain-containing protein n=1 Tax=Jatropha curcas TaxID=180498 RepID=A0A067KP72_JATCU|nr:WUSCHEL-related homeobox 8 [Jatropha curcas]KDP36778.1 hypothetical protein JCGZ_08069 [Jatropha curcas]